MMLDKFRLKFGKTLIKLGGLLILLCLLVTILFVIAFVTGNETGMRLAIKVRVYLASGSVSEREFNRLLLYQPSKEHFVGYRNGLSYYYYQFITEKDEITDFIGKNHLKETSSKGWSPPNEGFNLWNRMKELFQKTDIPLPLYDNKNIMIAIAYSDKQRFSRGYFYIYISPESGTKVVVTICYIDM